MLSEIYPGAEIHQHGASCRIAHDVLGLHVAVQYTRAFVLDFRGQFLGARPPVGPSDLVPDPVEHRLPEIGQQRAFPPVFEALQFLKHLNEGLLNKIVGIGRMTGHRGRRPEAQRVSETREQ
jgi:hypothetical protein